MALNISPETQAAIVANQIISQINQVITMTSTYLANGVPARGNQPAITAEALATAIGSVNVAKINSALSALA